MAGESPVKVIRHGSGDLYASMGETLLHVLAQVAPVHGLACLPRDHLAALEVARDKVLFKALHAEVTSIHACQHLGSCPLDAQLGPHMPGIARLCSMGALHQHEQACARWLRKHDSRGMHPAVRGQLGQIESCLTGSLVAHGERQG